MSAFASRRICGMLRVGSTHDDAILSATQGACVKETMSAFRLHPGNGCVHQF